MVADWGCPWCGEEWEGDAQHLGAINARAFDNWLEAHVEDCQPYLKEQGACE